MPLPPDGSQWYARRNGIVRGPFTGENMVRHILLGRIRLNDELSLDRINWRLALDYPQLFPRELLKLSSPEDYQRVAALRMAVDERAAERRRTHSANAPAAEQERRLSAERRNANSGAAILNCLGTNESMCIPPGLNNRGFHPLRAVLMAMLLLMLLFAYFGMSSR